MQCSALLDSSVILAYFKNDSRAVKIVQDSSELYCSVISVFEVLCGEQYLISKGFNSKIIRISDFFNDLNIINIDFSISSKASEIYGILKVKGLIINQLDLFILASAISKDLQLYTYDLDFKLITDSIKQFYNYDKIVLLHN